MTGRAPIPAADELRELACSFVAIARERGATTIRAELQRDGARIEVLVERKPAPGEADLDLEELVTVKIGPKTKPRTVVAIPAEWLT